MSKAIRSIEARHWPHLMDAARRVFSEDNPHGAFAFGIGPRIEGGRERSGVTLNVYVQRKLARPPSPVPPIHLRLGRSTIVLEPNVIATGRRPRAHGAIDVEFTGLHAGAAIYVDGAPRVFGGVACVLSESGVASYLLTAGHLFVPDAVGTAVFCAADASSSPIMIGTLAMNFLDAAGIDVAAVALSDDGVALARDTQGGPALADWIAEPSVWDKPVRAFRPTTNDYSRPTRTNDGPMDAYIEAPTRGSYWVRGVIGTDGTITDLGDSGTILCAGATNRYAVGMCVGEFHAHSICEPMGRAIQRLSRETGKTFEIITSQAE